MNSIFNFAIMGALVTIAFANSIARGNVKDYSGLTEEEGRISPLPPVPSPVSPPPASPEPASINVNLNSDFLMTTFGFTGEALASQQITEGVIGSSDVPATLVSSSSTSAVLEQSGATDEIAIVAYPEEAVSTLNAVNTEFFASGAEEVNATLIGTSAAVEYSGDSAVPLGGGFTLADANTEVEIMSAVEK